ncbi:hypothetical protein AA23498_2402 [Acetobacter nitrogenifigens DSM 23921 = NBRC 105050]|uniref:DUF2939 domain-containing protein n=1 Tax=Acetobacter nitrogenifigens DSM 23921 = NBRC 105050 TaxID=1120919 RepID=A0A511X7I0_9PROT|nr:DUF2939 domain-containing protein [Acetobacter nitrogenifigens]GBQ95691.1 hypothetical protein AA23498_2402 [Acetobacter nitrogenifigens DSM 23921 = NBRC 105050]GEN58907.1 hypothetical protein ANI02nite_07910 [Acetobacter nitrogenifigens DSM 23921 = NBRC 105050]
MKAAEIIPYTFMTDCPRRRSARKVCVAAFVTSFAIYAASPFMAMWSIATSVRQHDMVALGHSINWGLLDASLKQQVLTDLNLQPTNASDDLPAFGESFATNVVSNAVDIHVTQNNLGVVVDEAMAAIPKATGGGTIFGTLRHASGHFTRLDTFQAQVTLPGHENDTPLAIELRIEGWRWKLTRIDLPAPKHPVMEASATPHNA